MNKGLLRSAWAEIDKNRLIDNIQAVQNRVGDRKLIGVVKANAYGHGAVIVAKAYQECGVDMLAVATLEEANELRNAGFTCRIMMMGLIPLELVGKAVEIEVMPLISTMECAAEFSKQAQNQRKTIELVIAVDTGMGRIGFLPEKKSISVIAEIKKLPNIKMMGIMTHFSSADMEDLSYTYRQKEKFDNFYQRLLEAGIKIPMRTAANSPSILRLPSVFYEAVRPGTVIWGCYPACVKDHDTVKVRSVMSIKCRVIYLKTVAAGEAISYGRKYITRRDSVIATLPVGYADGYTRSLLGKARVLIHGEYAPVLGTICMDQIMADVTDIPGVRIGDEAVLLGRQGDKEIPIEELEQASGLCSGELFHGFTCRLPIVEV
ncbi:alanine racemase [Qiania dongpingensis]|uniref:Alanine racemase n=1 Tax=Qiania dongpingensis TaxID=2763669 RepID=A0A7G9G454_9FIRM|nr:alanine racemase [Qiania dongpingensis]QNM05586.1 alanine racemase [Qiania dongpingensis]